MVSFTITCIRLTIMLGLGLVGVLLIYRGPFEDVLRSDTEYREQLYDTDSKILSPLSFHIYIYSIHNSNIKT